MNFLKKIDSFTAELYKKDIVRFIFESNVVASYTDSYDYDCAVEKFEELKNYLIRNKAVVFGYLEDDKLVGFIWGYAYSFRDDKNRLYVSILHIDEKYRNCQTGNKLLNAMEIEAKKQGYSAIFLHVEGKNNGVIRFFEEMGYGKERIQLVKSIDKRGIVGEGIRFTHQLVNEYKDALAQLLYINTKSHFSCEEYSIDDANKQIEELKQYIFNSKAIVLGYVKDRSLIGFVWVFPLAYKDEKRYMLNAISVFPENRGKGIAKKLFRQAEIEIFNKGIKKIYTWVDCINISAYSFYINNGMNTEAYQLCKKLQN